MMKQVVPNSPSTSLVSVPGTLFSPLLLFYTTPLAIVAYLRHTLVSHFPSPIPGRLGFISPISLLDFVLLYPSFHDLKDDNAVKKIGQRRARRDR